jgi:transmembrane sensor
MATSEQIARLFRKQASSPLPADEQAVLDKWLAEFDDNAAEMKDFSELPITTYFKDYGPGSDELWERIKQQWLLSDHDRSIRRSRIRRGLSIAAVLAACIIVTVVSIWPKPKETAQVRPPVPPDKVVLTLSDGSFIVLDSTRKGELANEDGTIISLADDGKLVYTRPSGNKWASTADTVLYNKLQVPNGKQYQVDLPDGSHVWLNDGSTLSYPSTFNQGKRLVEVTGEAFFEVQLLERNGKSVPFIVKAGDMEIGVLGTRFNIIAYEDEREIKATLLEGKVYVKTNRETEGRELEPGKEALLDKELGHVQVKLVDTSAVKRWRNGNLVITDESLPTVLRRVSRMLNYTVTGDPGVWKDSSRMSAFADRDMTPQEWALVLKRMSKEFDFTINEAKKTVTVKRKMKSNGKYL